MEIYSETLLFLPLQSEIKAYAGAPGWVKCHYHELCGGSYVCVFGCLSRCLNLQLTAPLGTCCLLNMRNHHRAGDDTPHIGVLFL